MTLCSDHEQAIAEGAISRGLGAEVAGHARMAILNRAIERGGLEFVSGEQCPLCEADLHGGYAAEWLQGCLESFRKIDVFASLPVRR